MNEINTDITDISQEGCKFRHLNFPDTISKVYIFGSAIRLNSAVNSDADIFLIGKINNQELNTITCAIPKGKKADILYEIEDEFFANLQSRYSLLYKKVFEGGFISWLL